MTIKDIMKEWGLSYPTIQRALLRGDIPSALKYSNRGGYRVRRSDWEAYARQRWGLNRQLKHEQK